MWSTKDPSAPSGREESKNEMSEGAPFHRFRRPRNCAAPPVATTLRPSGAKRGASYIAVKTLSIRDTRREPALMYVRPRCQRHLDFC
jgi:hypothetical protein